MEEAMGRTTLVLDEGLLREAMRLAGVRTKREAVERALQEFIRARQRERLRAELGTFDLDLDPEELERLRREG
uniref:Type II toxin-antitoxin system VapB family antitoxin n=1 Tax=uncultured prokaryote TaxID=198431 RepID=H5SLD7_9ZZZZ|nr:hypothetical protein HGMM_F46A05C12 [uncultured prokaryote]